MIYWLNYEGHETDIKGKRNCYDNTIYTFDIETTSYIILNGKQLNTQKYLKLSDDEKQQCHFYSCMYIWQFGINDKIYYGRTWEDFKNFLVRLEYYGTNAKKIVFVHNLSFEFQFLRNIVKFDDVMARKSHKVMRATLIDFNIEFRCSYYMTNLPLKKLPEVYGLKVEKLVGDLDYSKIRHYKTNLTEKEMKYCEYDCLVVYEYIKKELEQYGTVKNIPLTSTGHVRRELKEEVQENWKYRNKVRKAVNVDGHIYNLLVECFAGGYTHANWIYANEIIKNVTSYDFTSSYPYVMVTHKFPSTEFRKCNIVKKEQMLKSMAYILVVKFKNISCKYYNNFISQNKCRRIRGAKYDNGRLISAEEIEIVLTDVDFYFITAAYNCEYEILESYFSRYDYLPKDFIEFILEKYVIKTKFKGIEEKKLEYNLEKAKFNSLYGMAVTNNIKDIVIFDNELGWSEIPLKNDEILHSLEKEKKTGFLSFAYGVWVTAWARYNLLTNVIKQDEFCAYCDTDSMKLKEGYNKKAIEEYNKKVLEKIDSVSKELEIDKEKFAPVDSKGKKHIIGLFDFDGFYEEFITQGAKKYAVTKYVDNKKINSETNVIKKGKEKSLILEITVAGVPKIGGKALKNLDEFKDDFVFDFKYTNKNLLMYNDEMKNFNLKDYEGNKIEVKEKYGCALIPTTYVLGKSEEYASLLSDESSKRAIFKE